MSSATVCASCHLPMPAGDAVRCEEVRTGRVYALHRPEVRATCLKAAGTRDRTRIALLDPGAAMAADRQRGGESKRLAFEQSARLSDLAAQRAGFRPRSATTSESGVSARLSTVPFHAPARGAEDRPAGGHPDWRPIA